MPQQSKESGRGVTTSQSMLGRGPRCGHCARFVDLTTPDANGTPSCPKCKPALFKDNIVTVVDAPDGQDG